MLLNAAVLRRKNIFEFCKGKLSHFWEQNLELICRDGVLEKNSSFFAQYQALCQIKSAIA
jgi:hypothetical protein